MKFLQLPFFLVTLLLLFASCKKNKTPTIQQRLDKGASISEMLLDFPVDSLLGKKYAGGVIFYIYETSGAALVVSQNELSDNAVWGCPGNDISGADSTGLGYGKYNTDDIIAECPDPNGAAGLCVYSNINGRTDWYLPSADEVVLIYQNLYMKGLGNFSASDVLWSSSEIDVDEAKCVTFSDGQIVADYKTAFNQVRAIRKE